MEGAARPATLREPVECWQAAGVGAMGVISTDVTDRAVGQSIPAQQSLGVLVALHLIPGALLTASFVLLAPVVERLGFPPIAALLTGIVVVLVPFELGVVVRARRRLGSPLAAVPYRFPMPARTWLWLVPTLLVGGVVGFRAPPAIEPPLVKTFFRWLPDLFVPPHSGHP